MQANDHIGITFAAAYNSAAGSIVTAGILVEIAATTEKAVKLKSLTRHGKKIFARMVYRSAFRRRTPIIATLGLTEPRFTQALRFGYSEGMVAL